MALSTAAASWAGQLAQWAIPDEILAQAPESPWHFSPDLFAAIAREALAATDESPSRRRAREALPDGGSVLDVGTGGGAGCLPLAPPAGLVIGLDPSEEMLAAFASAAAELGVSHSEVLGQWPEVEAQAPVADVVVCHNVLYNVAELPAFVEALSAHARHRVVVELTTEHPTATMRPMWRAIHGIERPSGPTHTDALAVLTEMGIEAGCETWMRSWSHHHDRTRAVAMARRRLCVGPERDAEIDELLSPDWDTPTREVAAIWWDPAPRRPPVG